MPSHRWIATPLLGVVSLFIAASTADARKWTNTEGQTLEAEFVRISNRAAVLRSGERLINAPLKRLSEADNAWIDRYRELITNREWSAESGEVVEGRFVEIADGQVRVKRGGKSASIAFEALSDEDWHYVAEVLKHLEQEMPEELLAVKPAPVLTLASGIAPADAIERTWTDATGREIVAGYLGVHESNALLWMREKEYRVPLSRLSPADRLWIANQSLSGINDGVRLAGAVFSHVMMRAATQGPPPTAVSPPPSTESATSPFVSPATRVAPSLPSEAALAANATPQPPAPPFIRHIDEMSAEEYNAALDKAFASFPPIDYDEPFGEAYCSNCEAEFVIPEGYGAGSPCPCCGVALSDELVTVYDDAYYADDGGYSRPWYLSRWVRRLVITAVLAAVGVGVKLANGGG